MHSRTLVILVAAFALIVCCRNIAVAGNTIQAENAKPGTTDWMLRANVVTDREIEGYASLTSVNRGGEISFYVNTAEPEYTIEVYRMGWYGGRGARLVAGPVTRKGTVQPIPTPEPVTGFLECNWTDPYTLTVPGDTGDSTNWASGVYLAKLTAGTSKKQNYIEFVVRDDARRSDFLVQSSVLTHQAYNDWGGNSFYTTNGTQKTAYKISFNRPYAASPAGAFLSMEYPAVRFLEREGYDVTYSTDLDTHEDASSLRSHKGFFSIGHDEYWTWQMRQNVEGALAAGVNLAFLGANAMYWQVRLEPSVLTGAPDRTVVGYKEDAVRLDPFAADPVNSRFTTARFRDPIVNYPEDALMGVMYESANVAGDITVSNASHWIYSGTGMRNGDIIPGVLGSEVDRTFENTPPGLEVVAHSPYSIPLIHAFPYAPADMSVYRAPSGGLVYASGTLLWSTTLDGYYKPNTHCAGQQMMRNVMARFLGLPNGLSSATTASAASGRCEIAPGSIATAYIDATSASSADLSRVTVALKDVGGIVRSATIYAISPTQVNFQIPPATSTGEAIVIVSVGDRTFSAPLYVSRVAPGIFSASGDGQGPAAAQLVRIGASGASTTLDVAQCSFGFCHTLPIDLGSSSDQIVLILYGTGIRNRSSVEGVKAQIGGIATPVQYAGTQGQFVGLDQVNIVVPRELIGRGVVDVTLTVDGLRANTVQIEFR